MNEKEKTFDELSEYHFKQACEHIRLCEISVQKRLHELTASLCDIDKDKMFENTDVVFIAHARWFYWYAYRYMTNESYDKIALQDFHGLHKFNARTVQNAVSKMSMMIENEPLWKRRWLVVRKLIKIYNKEDENEPIRPIIINVPKELKGIVRIETKEK